MIKVKFFLSKVLTWSFKKSTVVSLPVLEGVVDSYHWKCRSSNSTLMYLFQQSCTPSQQYIKTLHRKLICMLWWSLKFDFNVTVRRCSLSTDTSKSNSMLGTFSGIYPGGLRECTTRVKNWKLWSFMKAYSRLAKSSRIYPATFSSWCSPAFKLKGPNIFNFSLYSINLDGRNQEQSDKLCYLL